MRPLRYAYLAVPFAGALLLAASQGCFNPEYSSPGYYCHAEDVPACPEGQSCIGGRCIGGTTGDGGGGGGGLIPKTAMYTGAKVDPMLDNESQCTDNPLEPNDSSNTAIHIAGADATSMPAAIEVNGPPLKLGMLAICPTGNNPKADGHDVDYYKITAPQSVSAIVEITYDVKYGDLDVGIFRGDGSIVAVDGSAVSNGCAAASLPAGEYYVVVAGANNTDVNRYQLSVRFSTTPKSCSASGAGDMAQ